MLRIDPDSVILEPGARVCVPIIKFSPCLCAVKGCPPKENIVVPAV